ncbi:MAG: hypothetical protein P8N40_02675 [Gammaproteobacteria bacterium]|nr:hypothetical protein [Gammaproteobacteria bacterium]
MVNMSAPRIMSLLLITLSSALSSQEIAQIGVGSKLDPAARANEIRNNEESPRELSVLAPTIAAEEIDRAVLNRLIKEITNEPETTKIRLGISDTKMKDILITLSNARSFINNNEMANVRAMCDAWNKSNLIGDARIEQALDAYKQRDQFTKNFIAKYYRVVLFDIQSILNETEKKKFELYMNDRRRRMATSGTSSWGSVVENVFSGRDTVNFHCRRN